MQVLIIEDEAHNAKRLKTLLTEIDPTITVMAVLEGVDESIDWLKDNVHPDLIFTDVRLTDGLCFDIFAVVTPNCPLIFTTAFDEYALRAFQVNSIDYLLKPIKKEELQKSIHKYRHQQEQPKLSTILEDVALILRQQQKSYRTRFLISHSDAFYTILTQDIAYFYTAFRITRAVMPDGTTHILPFTMEELEEQLDPLIFFRVNRQYLINSSSINSINNYFNGKLHITLKPKANEKIIVSRDRAKAFKHWLDR